jgi:tetratricopeptide (TPR) repeat protein
VQHQPNLALAHFKRGAALERANRCGEAIPAYQIARDLEYDPGEVMARVGFCYRILADSKGVSGGDRGVYLQRAAMTLSRALQHDPNNLSALGNLADLAFNARDHGSALKLYQQMDRLDPSTPTTLARLGSTWALLGEHEKALEVLRRAAELAEQAQPAGAASRWIQRDAAIFSRLKAGESLIALGHQKRARRQLERVLEIADCPDCPLTSREVNRSRTRAEALLAELDGRGSLPAAPAPTP